MQINGKNTPYTEEKTLQALLLELGYKPQYVAVELNEEIVSRDRFEQVILKDTDVLEIVTFMGGGAR